jgi:hypothetical protein
MSVDFAAVADTEEVNRVLVDVHAVNNAIITDAKPAAIRTLCR